MLQKLQKLEVEIAELKQQKIPLGSWEIFQLKRISELIALPSIV